LANSYLILSKIIMIRKNGYYNLLIVFDKKKKLWRCESYDVNFPLSKFSNLCVFHKDKQTAKEDLRLLLDACYNKQP